MVLERRCGAGLVAILEHVDGFRVETPLLVRKPEANWRVFPRREILCYLGLGAPQDLRRDARPQFLDARLLLLGLGLVSMSSFFDGLSRTPFDGLFVA